MKLKSIRIENVRGFDDAVFDFNERVTVITGANGTGKSTILGSIIFALTGKFHGLPAMNVTTAHIVERTAGEGFRVQLRATSTDGREVLIVRTMKGSKNEVRFNDGSSVVTGKHAEARIVSLFGDVGFIANALNEDGPIWGLSREKRKAWAAALCRSASGWTRDRLVQEVGEATDDWNPDAMQDPSASLDLNIARLQEAVRGAQATARSAETTAENISGDAVSAPSKGEILVLVNERDAAADQLHEAAVKMSVIRSKASEFEKRRREFDALGKTLAGQQARLVTFGYESEQKARDAFAALEEEALQIDMDLTEARRMEATAAAKLEVQKGIVQGIEKATRLGKCPTCGQDGHFDSLLVKAQAEMVACADGMRRANRSAAGLAQRKQANAKMLSAVGAAISAYVDVEVLKKRIADFDDAGDSDEEMAAAAAAHEDARAKSAEANRKLEVARHAATLAREREAQAGAAVEARQRVESLKGLLARATAARDKMLGESVNPLREALEAESAIAPSWSSGWGIRVDGDILDIGAFDRASGDLVLAESLSTGERFRLTVALIAARARVRREPWSGVIFDGFEQVSEAERLSTLAALVEAAKSGVVDNAVLASATDKIAIDGVTSIHLESGESNG